MLAQFLVDHSTEAIAVTDVKGKIKYANASTLQVLGYKPEELIGNSGEGLIHPDDIARLTEDFKDFEKHPGKVVHTEGRFKHKDGNWRYMELVSTNLFHEPEVQGVVTNYRDITEHKEIERRKDEFISIASHELKTPVTALKGYSQILHQLAGKNGYNELLPFIKKIENQTDRLTQLINSLLDVSKVQENKLQLEKDRFNFDLLVKDVAEDMQLVTDRHKITVSLKSNAVVCADKYRIAQVLMNFINNAIKYSPKADKINISTYKDEDKVVVSIEDFGVGVPRRFQKLIFNRFFQVSTKIRGSFFGLGLGLYISSEIIKKHKGKIWVESTKGIGSTFYFSLPYES